MLQLKIKKQVDGDLLFAVDTELTNGLYLITGENGCGKSTLLNIISGLDKDYCGEVLYNNQALNREEVCYIMQTPCLFDELNCLDNFKCLIGEEKLRDIENVIELLDFKKIFYSKRKVSKLSGGELQKLNIIINTARKCNVYLIDEIENNLDDISRKVLPDIVKMLSGIVLIPSHHTQSLEAIANYQLSFEHRKILKAKISDNYQFNTVVKNTNKSELEQKDIKLLGKFNVYNRILLGIILIIAIAITTFVVSSVIFSMQYIHRPVENFQNNAMIISPPINNELYDSLGDESWLRNTAANFNNEDFEYMQALDGVETIKSIPSVTGRAGSYSFYTEDRIYKYEQTLNYQSLDYAKFGLEEYKENDEFSPVSLQNLIYPQDFASNTPYVNTAIGGNIIAGNYPSDNSNQILVDVYSAIYLATQYDKLNIEDLLGVSITVPLIDDNVQYEWEFQISGIYVADNVGESVIYASYDPKAEIVQRNDCSLYPDKESIEYGRCLKNDANFDLDVELTAEEEAEIGDYAAIYIKVRDDEAEKQVYETIKKYDPYIYIDSNYGRAQSTSFVYFKHYYQKLVLLLLLTIISFSMIIQGIKKLLEVEFAKIDKTLILFAFNTQEIQKIKQREYRYLNIMYILFMCIYLFIYNLQFGFDWKYIMLIIGINILLMLVMNMILRGDIKWRKK